MFCCGCYFVFLFFEYVVLLWCVSVCGCVFVCLGFLVCVAVVEWVCMWLCKSLRGAVSICDSC